MTEVTFSDSGFRYLVDISERLVYVLANLLNLLTY